MANIGAPVKRHTVIPLAAPVPGKEPAVPNRPPVVPPPALPVPTPVKV